MRQTGIVARFLAPQSPRVLVCVVEHLGDTRGNDWYTKLVCLLADMSAAAGSTTQGVIPTTTPVPQPATSTLLDPSDPALYNVPDTSTPPTNQSYLVSGDQLTPEQQKELADMGVTGTK
jgi:hypothetical protein